MTSIALQLLLKCVGTVVVLSNVANNIPFALAFSSSSSSSVTKVSSSLLSFHSTKHTNHHCCSTSSSTTTQLHMMNVPPPSLEDEVDIIKDRSSREKPPSSFYELQLNSVKATKMAINDGYDLLEIEFPPLPANVLEMDDVSAYEVAKANINLALEFAKSFANPSISNKKVAILLPDEVEAKIAIENLGYDDNDTNSNNPYPNVLISSLRQPDENDERVFKPEQLLLGLFGQGSGGTVKPIPNVNMYICIVASAQELPDIEELYEQLQVQEEEEAENNEKPVIIFYNLKLDVLRGDLGAPAFPPKEFQDRFLSKVKPVYYLRTRQYSRSTSQPPFMVNYQGCLFRSYPGQYQTLLDTGNGQYRRVCGSDIRPALGEFKEQLTNALKVEGVLQEESSTLNFLRTGYKTTTWWEEERTDASNDWKS